jgi:hypothetical protein
MGTTLHQRPPRSRNEAVFRMGTGSDETGASAGHSRALVNLPQERKRNTATPQDHQNDQRMCPVPCELSLPVHQAHVPEYLIRLSTTLFFEHAFAPKLGSLAASRGASSNKSDALRS